MITLKIFVLKKKKRKRYIYLQIIALAFHWGKPCPARFTSELGARNGV